MNGRGPFLTTTKLEPACGIAILEINFESIPDSGFRTIGASKQELCGSLKIRLRIAKGANGNSSTKSMALGRIVIVGMAPRYPYYCRYGT